MCPSFTMGGYINAYTQWTRNSCGLYSIMEKHIGRVGDHEVNNRSMTTDIGSCGIQMTTVEAVVPVGTTSVGGRRTKLCVCVGGGGGISIFM